MRSIWLKVLLFGYIGTVAASQIVPAQEIPFDSGVQGLIEMAEANGIGPIGTQAGNTFLYTFTRNGQFRKSLVLLPRAVFETDMIETGSGQCVSLVVAVPFNLGDGVSLEISIRSRSETTVIMRVSLDPAHVRAHRTWVPIRFDIPAQKDALRLRFEVDAGTRGDETGDWIGIAAGNDSGCLFAP